ncbi:MAG: Redox-active disulfide protein 2 [Candidatus Syntrophoarchaeum caldarius]|uniref:Thioredoxin n=1 Tax=Candidatus Syntropharchaeum caldarium TaxID=1838285 RepID=A0A1F2P9T5_9EURY|nr:MAG: Redox-active disulfide protein 2 [Candidatus Syntrophoarchaeum caldarius]
MRIEVLGTGCAKCNKMEENVRKAVEELDIQAEIEKVSDIGKIIEYGVMTTPALVIDGEVKASGRIVDVDTIKKWLKGET